MRKHEKDIEILRHIPGMLLLQLPMNAGLIPAQGKNLRGKKNQSGSKKIRVAAYCRVSTDREEQLNSFENQVDYYTKYINENPEYEMVDIYSDEGISGTNTKKRDGFNRMIADCEAGKIDLIIIKSISRFARNTQDCLSYSRKLKGLGIGIIFEKENINTMDASGELLFTILSSLAQEESRNISENSKWALRHNYRQGIVRVNTKGFMGYDADKDGNLIINPEQAKLVRRVFREFEEGWTPNEIAKRLNEDKIKGVKGRAAWDGSTIRGMLTNEKYKGDARLQKSNAILLRVESTMKEDGSEIETEWDICIFNTKNGLYFIIYGGAKDDAISLDFKLLLDDITIINPI